MLSRRSLLAAPLLAAIVGMALPAWAQNGTLTFLHVNDVYEIAPVKGQGGFGPLMTLLKRERAAAPDAITTVGGDFLSPSLLSGTTRGEQMITLFNAIGVDAVTFGNHEFDFGPDLLKQRMAESKFPWIGTNVWSADGSAFANTVPSWTRTIDGITVGFIGLITPDTARLSSAGPSLSFPPVLETAAAAVKELRAKGASVVVALTHLTIEEDRELASKVKSIDLILGGHDHDPISFYEGSTLILKAGHDAQYLGVVKLAVETKDAGKGPVTATVPTEWRFVTTAGVAPDPEVETVVEGYTKRLDSDLAAVIGTTTTDLDSRKDVVRSREASMGNLIADALRDTLKADVAITNGGGIRADALHPAGSTLTRKDIFAELPFGNVGVLVEMSGQDLISTLEHGVSKVEEKAGRFPQVSGLTMTYDPKAPAGRRVTSIMVGGKPVDPQATYRIATNDYMLKGGDGYAAFPRSKVIVDASGAVLLATIVMNYVEAKKTVAPAVEGRIVAK
ncbi:2',3'-cyclic-nucleotide 2'-phosphodiesterase (5'-nucleotidase family) [Azospirillum lipoferum]|uniref:Bifunctional metallophosphatase/5'-nucleotidase n=1 Tax=Azospirillum lipoferum TaxID=193 RepID=A0A5A9GJ42_AZOLI|nr:MULTISPECIES: 5'-nucleotidase C-terminal domain-containing protein [Azospirillum]KAA0594481.1 bifunctional metallophosphatase/5'-nucleotidase [Azospirillum lipoferum]MCP1613233.1 2',3'-cyclic-nucleotide 2'-phosphodiesterase (5'-nucleotidase family) [Azospirillum lipoferum]MDW5531432.1 5'-nucleotidase C-terminal domain-containing protein [Azospirillum sp. NL1]